MSQAAITLNGRVYRLRCAPGDEARLEQLAALVRAKCETLGAEFGPIGDDRLFLMAALLLADELVELREAVGEPADGGAAQPPAPPGPVPAEADAAAPKPAAA